MNEQEYISGMLNRTLLFYDRESVEKVRDTVFAISGLGGVGAITAELLARWGVKKFRLLDMDCYDPSNLNRQLFATSRTLARRKVDVTAERIKEINPFAEVELTVRERVTNENVLSFVKGAGVIVQSADHPSCKLFYLSARKHGVPVVNGYSTVTGGRIQTFDYRRATRSHFWDSYWDRLKYGDMKPLEQQTPDEIASFDCDHVHPPSATLNFVTNTIGCLMVAEAIKLITARGKVILYPKYLEFDVLHWRLRVRSSNSLLNLSNLSRLGSVLASRIRPGKSVSQ